MTQEEMASDAFEKIDERIEALHERLSLCRRAMLVSLVAIYGGGAVAAFVLTIAGSYRTPVVVLGAITAIIGGMVWLGANSSSRAEAEAELAEAQAVKARLFDEVATRNGWRDLTPTVH
jgi:hypothetical protein